MAMTVMNQGSLPAELRAEAQLAQWCTGLKRSVLRQMIAVVSRPGILSFAGGLPAPELFPVREYRTALDQVLAEDPCALQYGPPLPTLKRHVVELMQERGVACSEEQVFLTTGAQQALDVVTRLLLNPGGEVLIEEVVYSGIQQAIAPRQPVILDVPTDLDTGMDLDAVARWLAGGHRPAYIYVVPDAHNPLGVSLSPEKRTRLVELAREFQVPLLEDDPYGFLIYDADPVPPMRSQEADWVFYAGSFSKIMAPALRLGWLIAPERLVPQLTVVKEAVDLESSQLTQRAVAAFLDAGHLPAHVAHLRHAYRERRDTMLATLAQTFPSEARWTRPAGGMFIWVELPEHVNTVAVLDAALEQEQIAFIPGHAFAVPGAHANHCMRLSFSNVAPERITDGIGRLAQVVSQFL